MLTMLRRPTWKHISQVFPIEEERLAHVGVFEDAYDFHVEIDGIDVADEHDAVAHIQFESLCEVVGNDASGTFVHKGGALVVGHFHLYT